MVSVRRIIFFLFIIQSLFLLFVLQAYAVSDLTVTFLDAGEGDAIYIETSTGEKILIDTGNPRTGFNIANFLNDRGINTLDAIFITHPHPDHMGGVFHILPGLNIKTIYDNGQPIPKIPDCDIYRWYEEAARRSNYRQIAAGEVFQYGDMTLQVLWPRSPSSSDWNANSLVLKIVYGKTTFLLMGDANTFVEKALVDEGVNLKAQVLKVGHHGAQDATSMEFLEAVAPAYAVISVNDRNVRGYPAVEVLKRLKNRGIKTFLTYRSGDIVFTLDHQEELHILVSKSSKNGF